jgi:Fe-S-cluster containining protein
MQLMQDVGRSCGECNACCKPFIVTEVDKHDASWCKHCIKGRGCAIYESRPLACQLWTCLWLNGKGGESQRPDLFGVMLDSEDVYLPTRVVCMMHIYEMKYGTALREDIVEMIELNLEAGNIVAVHRIADSRSYDVSIRLRKAHFTQVEKEFIDSGAYRELRKQVEMEESTKA